jgi:hypothetical protein
VPQGILDTSKLASVAANRGESRYVAEPCRSGEEGYRNPQSGVKRDENKNKMKIRNINGMKVRNL